MQCHKVDYAITGRDIQSLEIGLDPGETVIAEAGTLNYMDDAIRFETRLGDGSPAAEGMLEKLVATGKRLLTGESLFMTHFTNTGDGKRHLAFSAPFPGRIIDMDMASLGNEVFCQKDAFLCAACGTQIGIAFTRRLGTGFFSGDGFVLHRLTGDGMAFVHAGGAVVEKTLRNETIRVDTGCIVAFTTGIEYSIPQSDGLRSMFFGGQGLFLATLSGTGTVLLQTLPFSRMADRVIQNAPALSGRKKNQGALLERIRRRFNGDSD
ncbi:MAG: TIGR00266 family protein [Thermodesulfobacteriota bacterium]